MAAAGSADVVLNAVVGFAGLPVTMAALEAGKRLALANKESLIAGAPVVQKARRTPGAEIVPVDSEHCALHQCLAAVQATHRRRPASPHRVGRPLPRLDGRAPRHGHGGRRAGPPDMVDGAEDHDRLVHAHEQGPRGDRGPRAVRHRLRPHRHRRAPAVDRALHGGAARRVDPGPAVEPRHAPPHRLRPRLARPRGDAVRGDGLVGPDEPDLRAARPHGVPLHRAGLRSRPVAAARPRPGSARPTRWPSRPSWATPCPGAASPTWWPRRWTAWVDEPVDQVEAVLAADAEARARARLALDRRLARGGDR